MCIDDRQTGQRKRLSLVLAWLGSAVLATALPAAAGTPLLLAQADVSSFDDLFDDTANAVSDAPEAGTAAVESGDDADSLDALFDDEPETPSTAPRRTAGSAPARLTGFYHGKFAYTYENPEHWSRAANTLELSLDGRNSAFEWKLSGRAVYDAVFDIERDFYPRAVEHDQRHEFSLRETYIDISRGDWDFRLGRQHIVWGEMVGLFFADVVSAKDMRELVLQDFDMLRIPQWAARAEYFRDDLHAEFVWIPYMSYDEWGRPGGEYFSLPVPDAFTPDRVVFHRDRPHGLDDGALGVRLTYLVNGWDLSAFHYSSRDATPAFAHSLSNDPLPRLVFTERHERIAQTGATLAKDFGSFVLKGEAIYTHGRPYAVLDPLDRDGLVKQKQFDYVLGLEWALPEDGRLNLQFFQRWFPDHEHHMVPDELESGVSFLASRRFAGKWEPEVLLIQSLNRNDRLLRAKLTWHADGNWKLAAGVDVFSGPMDGMFGQYDPRDRVYAEARFSF